MTTLTPIEVAVEIQPITNKVEVSPLANNVEVNEQKNKVVVTAVGMQGATGPTGPAGGAVIGGYPVALQSVPQDYDALMFKTGTWTNIPQTEITDGGNY